MKKLVALISSVVLATLAACSSSQTAPLVLETDFGVVDGAVAAMKGVALSIDPKLVIHDLTHEIEPFNIWEGAYRLAQAAPFWLKDTVIVAVVDPGVGTSRSPIVVRTKSGHLFVGPDNGLFTLVGRDLGIDEIRRIDEHTQLRPGSEESHTFHGRDLFVYVGARLASGRLEFEDVGPRTDEWVKLDVPAPRLETGPSGHPMLCGIVTVLDARFGNVWTNLDEPSVKRLGAAPGSMLVVRIRNREGVMYDGRMPMTNTFGDVGEGLPLAYLNSNLELAFALNLGNFAHEFAIGTGPEWAVEIELATDAP